MHNRSIVKTKYLTIIPRARMGSESIAHEGERNNCFSKIQLVGQKCRDKTTLASISAAIVLVFKSYSFRY